MSNLPVEHPALKECLNALEHLFIDISRLKHEPLYKEKRGGYCDVQIATLDSAIPQASKLVAVKKLFLGIRTREPLRLAVRLARELKIWAGLRHPHVLPVLGFYLGDNYETAILISEYMQFGDLEGYITKEAPTYVERLRLVCDLTDGLAYLHSQSIRHGDLKPGNVLVNPQRRALLADFGLSKALDAGPTGFTTGNDGRGTVRFSSPEILLLGAKGYSLANDMWSWACLILEVMANRIPFPDIPFEPQLIIALIKGQAPCDAEILALHLPQFNDLLLKCWNQEPNQRPNAVDCLSSLQSTLLSLQPQELPSQQTLAPAEVVPFREFFIGAFNSWLAQRQLTLEPPRVDGKDVELHKLFFMVGALGGCRTVFEKKLWPVVGAKIGFPYFNGPLPYSKPEVADQLSKVYQKILADFEVHWYNSLRPRDPTSIFPLPQPLQYLHPEIERLATAQFPLPQQQQQLLQQQLNRAGPPQQPDGNARGPTPNQMAQQPQQLGQSQAATQQQEVIMRNQQGMTFSSQPGPSGQGGPMAGVGIPNLSQLPLPLQQLFTNPEVMKLSPEELKRRGLSDEIIQKVIGYRQQLMAKALQGRKEQELQMQQQRQLQAQAQQQAANLLNTQRETPQLAPANRPSSGLGNALQPSALPQHGGPQGNGPLLPGLNDPPEQLIKAQEKVRAAIGLFHNKRDYSSINLSPEQAVLLESSINQTQSLLKQVAQNLVSFVVLAPNDERELNQVAQTVVTLSDQAQILQKQPPEKRFIFGFGDLNNYRQHLTTFMMRVRALQGQAMALQNQWGLPPPVTQQEPPAPPLQPPAQMPMRPPTAEPPRPPIPAPSAGPIAQPQLLSQTSVVAHPKPGLPPQAPMKQPIRKPMPPTTGPMVSSPYPVASTPVNQAPTPAPAESPNTPKYPVTGSKGAPNKTKSGTKTKLPPNKRGLTKPTRKIPPAEVPGPSPPEGERKRPRVDDLTGPDGSAGPSGSKRARIDPQEDLDTKRNADIAAAKQLTIEGSLEFLEKTLKDYEKVAAAPATTENGAIEPSTAVPPTIGSALPILDLALFDYSVDLSATVPGLGATPVPSQDALASGVKLEEEGDDWSWALDPSQWAIEDPGVGETPDLVPSVSSQGPTPISDVELDMHTASAAPAATVPTVRKLESADTERDFWASIGVSEGRFDSDDTDWKWEGTMESNGEWPISYSVM